MPAVVHLLNVQRDIAEANYAGLTAIFDPNTRRTAQVDLPRILSLSAEAATEYQRFAGMRDQSPGVAPLKASISRLLARWRGVATQTKQVASASPPISPTVVLAAYANADATIVNPLSTDLNRLVRVEIQGMD